MKPDLRKRGLKIKVGGLWEPISLLSGAFSCMHACGGWAEPWHRHKTIGAAQRHCEKLNRKASKS